MRNGREIDAVHIFLRYVPHRQWQVQRLQCFTQDAQKRRHEKDMKGIVGTKLGSLRFHMHGWISSRSIQSCCPQFTAAYHISETFWIDIGLIIRWMAGVVFYTLKVCPLQNWIIHFRDWIPMRFGISYTYICI